MDFVGKRVVILGLAREGASLAHFLAERGASVTVTDVAPAAQLGDRLTRLQHLPIAFALGAHHPELIAGADHFFVSPGVPETSPVYAAARAAGMEIGSMTSLFFELCPAPIVGVTGSSGKTTTTSLIGHILRESGRDVHVAGNIGRPMLELLKVLTPQSQVVLELSSFQLALLRRSPHVAVVTNISPNHLDRHGTMDAYIAAKRNILAYQRPGDHAVLNEADPIVREMAGSTRASVHCFCVTSGDGAARRGDEIGMRSSDRFLPIMRLEEIPLLGSHNVENVLAAAAVGSVLGVDAPHIRRAVRTFKAPPHRLQTVAQRDGVRYVDDSIATSPTRAAVALRAIDAPILLIAGGRDKCLPWTEFARTVAERVRGLFLIGEAAAQIEAEVRAAQSARAPESCPLEIRRCDSLEGAVASATRVARPGDVILLSPACTSYDMFQDFVERGERFAGAVRELVHAA